MICPDCQSSANEEDIYCRTCGAELPERPEPSRSIVAIQRNLPTVLYNSAVSRSVAASVGAVAFGVGLELLRRGIIARLSQPPKPVENALPALSGLKDILMPQNNKPMKLPRGYEVHETVIYMRRVIRKES